MGLEACPAAPPDLWSYICIFLYLFQHFSTLKYHNKKAGEAPLSNTSGVPSYLPNVRFSAFAF